MKHIKSILIFTYCVLSFFYAHSVYAAAIPCSGTVTATPNNVTYSYTKNGSNVSGGVYNFGTYKTSNGSPYNVQMTFSGSATRHPGNACIPDTDMQISISIAQAQISTFLSKNTDSWIDTSSAVVSCGNTHTYYRYAGSDATCGPNAKNFAYTDTAYPSTSDDDGYCSTTGNNITFDAQGNYVQYPAFPAVGGSTTWTCGGLDGGDDVICTATRDAAPINGQCSSLKNTCTFGDFKDLNDSSNEYKWECLGRNNGTNSPVCNAPIPADPADENNGDNSNGGDSAIPACILSTTNPIVPVGSASVFLSLEHLPHNASSYSYDWSSSNADLNAFSGSEYTIVTSTSTVITNNGVVATHDNGQNGANNLTLSCPDVVVANVPKAYIDKPIVEEDKKCTLRWDDVDATNALCVIKNQAGQTLHTIPGVSGTYTDILPTDPNNKYFVSCTYQDAGSVVGTIQSEYVSCIKRGQLQEI